MPVSESYPTADVNLMVDAFGSLSKQIFRDLIFETNTR